MNRLPIGRLFFIIVTNSPEHTQQHKDFDSEPRVQQYLSVARRFTQEYYDKPEHIRQDGTTKIEHIDRILGLYDQFEEIPTSPGLTVATYIHDRVKYLTNPNTPLEEKEELLEDLQSLIDIDEQTTMYAIGIALSAERFEEEGEYWRHQVRNILTYPGDNSRRILSRSLEETLGDNNTPDRVLYLENALVGAITNGDNNISQELLDWRAPLGDIENMARTLVNWDIEGLVLKSLEIMDNLKHPNPSKPASAWRDAQELLSFYAPLLELGEFNELSREAYSYAYQFLHRDPEFISCYHDLEAFDSPNEAVIKAKDIHEAAKRFTESQFGGYSIDQIIRQSLANFGGEVSGRIKSIGSILEKLRKGEIPDTIGYKLVLPDDIEFSHIRNLIDHITSTIEELGKGTNYNIELGHARSGDPTVEMNFAEITDEAYIPIRNGLYRYEAPPRAISNYSAAHINFHYPDPMTGRIIGIEIQITRERENENNTREEGHHVFYKASKGIGIIAELRRMVEESHTPDNILYYRNIISLIIDYISSIRRRAEIFRRGEANHILSPGSYQEVQSIIQEL